MHGDIGITCKQCLIHLLGEQALAPYFAELISQEAVATGEHGHNPYLVLGIKIRDVLPEGCDDQIHLR